MDYIEIPVFSGKKLRPWLDWMENHFVSEDVTDLQKQAMAYGFIEGEAKVWFNARQSWLPFSSWKMIKTSLLLRFGDEDDSERIRLEQKNKQLLEQWRENRARNELVQTQSKKTKSTKPHASFPLKSEVTEKKVTYEHKLTLAGDSNEEELRQDTKEIQSDGAKEKKNEAKEKKEKKVKKRWKICKPIDVRIHIMTKVERCHLFKKIVVEMISRPCVKMKLNIITVGVKSEFCTHQMFVKRPAQGKMVPQLLQRCDNFFKYQVFDLVNERWQRLNLPHFNLEDKVDLDGVGIDRTALAEEDDEVELEDDHHGTEAGFRRRSVRVIKPNRRYLN